MSDPKRLLEQAGMGADLLRSARGDAPSHNARMRTAVALGIVAGTAATTTAASASTAAAASKWGAYSGAVLFKWLGIGALGGALTVGAVEYATVPATRAITTSVALAPPAPATARARRGSIPAPVAVAAPDPTVAAPVPTVAAPLALAPKAEAPAVAPSRLPPPSASVQTLADEVQSLDRARTALASGDTRAALDALDAHDRGFASKNASLAPEAAVLRIETLVQRGDDAAATAGATAFLAAYPDSPQARRVHSVLALLAAKKKP